MASQNPGKAREIARIMADWEVSSLTDHPPVDFPEEGGDYTENARVKAQTAARVIGLPCVADDSGLEVEALDGRPGAYSARYGGPGLDDAGRFRKLLEELAGSPAPRAARFYCVAACAWPDGTSVVAEGECRGQILEAPRGEGGFGYDPVFAPDAGGGLSMAELGRAEKDAISHRGRALEALAPLIAARGAAG
ncbi:MAG: RdgB/HAM1 family non-canonical purine NTP pyrophosphatase [Myxococcota bacterium]